VYIYIKLLTVKIILKMKLSQFRRIIKEEVRKVLKKESAHDQGEADEANADLFIKNPALKTYITNNDQYGFAIMEVPVAKLEAAMKMKIKDILAYAGDMLSISMDPSTKTVDIQMDRMDY